MLNPTIYVSILIHYTIYAIPIIYTGSKLYIYTVYVYYNKLHYSYSYIKSQHCTFSLLRLNSLQKEMQYTKWFEMYI